MNKLGTCCQILDSNGKQYKDTIIGTVQQSAIDKILSQGLFEDHKTITNNPTLRTGILANDNTKYKACHAKLLSKVKQNLNSLLKQLKHIAAMPEQCKMFRISSGLLPLFDHPEYSTLYDDKMTTVIEYGLSLCKKIIDDNNIIVSAHPDQFVVINSDRESVRHKSFVTLEYHRYFLSQLTTADNSCINIHVTGKLDHIPELDQGLYSDLIPWLSFENDDTNIRAGVLPTLTMCNKYNIKMVYDLHHDYCEHLGKRIAVDDDRIMASILNTWGTQTPLFHASDCRDSVPIDIATPRKLSPHSDYIVSGEVVDLVGELLEFANVDIEAKHKNLSVLDLYNKLK